MPLHHFDNGLRYRDADHPHQTALTPEYVLEPVRLDLGGRIGLDPCTTPDNPVDARVFYTPPEDGLALAWGVADTIFVNPPYGKAREAWVQNCIAYGFARKIILLIPAHTDTRILQAALRSSTAAVFIRGRVKFGVLRPNRRQVAASHPSVLIGWGTDLEHCGRLGVRMAKPAS